MKKYKYRARKSPTEMIGGTLEALSQEEAVEQINRMGLMPVDVDEIRLVEKKAAKTKPAARERRRVPAKDLTVYFRQASRLLKSGVPILMAHKLLSDQTESAALKGILQHIENDVRGGQSLSGALLDCPDIFGRFEISMVQAGESIGKLDEALARIADYREKQAALLRKIRSATAYPLFVICVGIGTVAFMLTVVIPKFAGFFKDLGQDLPWATKALIDISHWCQKSFIFIVLAVVILILLLRRTMRAEASRLKWDTFVLRLPVIGKMLLMSEIARFARTMEILIRSGRSLLDSIRIAVPVLDNHALRAELEIGRKSVEEGAHFSDVLIRSKYFPALTSQMIRIGEESGRLEETLCDIADWYEQETAERIKLMTDLLEPVTILIVGLLLGFIIIAVLLPIFSMNAMVS